MKMDKYLYDICGYMHICIYTLYDITYVSGKKKNKKKLTLKIPQPYPRVMGYMIIPKEIILISLF